MVQLQLGITVLVFLHLKHIIYSIDFTKNKIFHAFLNDNIVKDKYLTASWPLPEVEGICLAFGHRFQFYHCPSLLFSPLTFLIFVITVELYLFSVPPPDKYDTRPTRVRQDPKILKGGTSEARKQTTNNW